MANHKSSLKRIRQTAARKAHNHYYAKTARKAKRHIIHTNKAANLKSKLARMINKLA